MFILTFKWTKKNAVLIVLAVAALISAAVVMTGIADRRQTRGVRTNEDRLAYLSALGWECQPLSEQSVVIPRQFSDVFEDYNRLQKLQGFDLLRYGGVEVTLYRYSVSNYPGDDSVIAQLLVSDYEVIGGDLHSSAQNGFIHGMR